MTAKDAVTTSEQNASGLRCPSVLVAAVLLASAGISFPPPVAAASVAAALWWWPSNTDVSWTNKSLEDIRVAAERGDATAEYYLGRASFIGQGCSRDLGQALAWIQRSAEHGDAQGQFALGRFHYAGIGTTRNPAEGFAWVERAAKQDHADAIALLGRAYEYGDGTRRDAQRAFSLLQRGVDAGSRIAPKWMGEFYLRGQAGTARRTNYLEALRWFERAGSNGVVSAALEAADLLTKGMGTPADPARAVFWLRFAVDQNHEEGLEELARAYAIGVAEPRSPAEMPIHLFRRAAEIRVTEFNDAGPEWWSAKPSAYLTSDCRELWNRYRFGVGTPRDYVAAAQWMWQAFQEDCRRVAGGRVGRNRIDREAPNPFDAILSPTNRVRLTIEERRWREAVQLINEALAHSQPAAWHRIGESYRDGSKLTPSDPVLAWGWFARAAELGHPSAREAQVRLEGKLDAIELARAKQHWIPPLPRAR